MDAADGSAADASDTGTDADQPEPNDATDTADESDGRDSRDASGSPLDEHFDGPATDLLGAAYGNFAAMTRLRVVDKHDRSAPPSSTAAPVTQADCLVGFEDPGLP